MKREILVTIDCEDETCGECRAYLCYFEQNGLRSITDERMPECIAAEKAAGDRQLSLALFPAHHGASPAPTTRRDAERVTPESAQSGGGMGNAYARGGGR